jgi:hypothetical protein
MGSIVSIPTNSDFGAPKQDDPSVVISNPENEVFRASNHQQLVDRIIELYEELGISTGINAFTTLGSLWRALGNPNGSTPGSAWEAIAALEGGGGGGSTTQVVWRPDEPSPAGNIYATWGALHTAISTVQGRIQVFVDTTLGAATIPSGAYGFAATEVAFLHSRQNATARTDMTVATGVTFTGFRFLTLDGVELIWSGAASCWTVNNGYACILLDRGGAVTGLDNTAVFGDFTGTSNAMLLMRDVQCGVVANDYELFAIGASGTVLVSAGTYSLLAPDVFRGDGNVTVIGDSANLSQIYPSQANLTTPMTIMDGATSSPVMAALHRSVAQRVTEVVWRPDTASSTEALTWAAVMNAITGRTGVVHVIIDDAAADAVIPAGDYQLACVELCFKQGRVTQRPEVTIEDGVTFTPVLASSLSRFRVDGCDVIWEGSAPAFDMDIIDIIVESGGKIEGHATSTGPMFEVATGAYLMLREQCNFRTNGYELFVVNGVAALYVTIVGGTLLNDVLRGNGNVFAFYSSFSGSVCTTTQTNLSNPITTIDFARGTTQNITSYDANITARFVSLEPGSGNVFMPAINLGEWVVIATGDTGVTVNLRPLSDDSQINGGSSLVIDTTYIGARIYFVMAVNIDGNLGWQTDDAHGYLNTTVIPAIIVFSGRLDDLEAFQLQAQGQLEVLEGGGVPAASVIDTTSVGPHNIPSVGGALVGQGYAGAMSYVMPPAIAGARVEIVKRTTDTGFITLTPDGSDTIHGSALSYQIPGSDYVTSATTRRKRWTAICFVDGDWDITGDA